MQGGLAPNGELSEEPVSAGTEIRFSNRVQTVTVRTDTHGRFEARLSPGRWTVSDPSSTEEYTIVGGTRFTVVAGRSVRVELRSICNVC